MAELIRATTTARPLPLPQAKRQHETKYWATQVKEGQKKLRIAIVAANNHYAGFGPATAYQFRAMLGQE
jgi:hypothetical protein